MIAEFKYNEVKKYYKKLPKHVMGKNILVLSIFPAILLVVGLILILLPNISSNLHNYGYILLVLTAIMAFFEIFKMTKVVKDFQKKIEAGTDREMYISFSLDKITFVNSVQTGNSTSENTYDQVKSMKEYNNVFFIMLNNDASLIFPKSAMISGEMENFTSLLKEKLEKKYKVIKAEF